jgi:DNA-binding response OmpR family regulator
MKRILLVCAADCRELQERLVRSGCFAITVNNGAEAILRAKHESIDTALLVSTGKDMDIAETALNLSDINSSLEIIIIMERKDSEQRAHTDEIQHAIPQMRILTAQEFSHYLSRHVSGESATRAKT